MVHAHELARDPKGVAIRVADELGLPVFVKPANSGSSVGIQKVTKLQSLPRALAEASRYDTKLLVETALDAREIEVAVLGNEEPEASVPGEIRTRRDFYDYEAKYVDESTELLVPAPLSEAESDAVRDLAIRAYRELEGAGLGRVDFLMERSTGTFYLNELNSLPGFTEVSMYPRLWEATGLPYPQLLDRADRAGDRSPPQARRARDDLPQGCLVPERTRGPLVARIFGVDVRALAAMRIGIGLILVVDLASRARHFAESYSDARTRSARAPRQLDDGDDRAVPSLVGQCRVPGRPPRRVVRVRVDASARGAHAPGGGRILATARLAPGAQPVPAELRR